jgi:S1-C subfamily serine protease
MSANVPQDRGPTPRQPASDIPSGDPETTVPGPLRQPEPDPFGGLSPAAPIDAWAEPNQVRPYPPYPPYQSWPSGPGYGALPAASPKRGGASRMVLLVLAVALLSASLSAIGTYVAIGLTSRTNVVVPASSIRPVAAEQVTLTQSDVIVRIADQVMPSVVTILTTDPATRLSPSSEGAGSGFIVAADGLILTNNHVVAGASSIMVVLNDGQQLKASVVATEPAKDLALVRVIATGLTPVTLGDSSSIKVGQLAVAIGSPLGQFTESVTQGIVSGVDRSITVGDPASRTSEDLTGLIQTDAAISPGSSGGPLLDASGSVVGIVVASSSSAQDMGFAIPINQAKALIAGAAK